MHWETPEGRAVQLVIITIAAVLFVLALSAGTAAFLGISFSLVFLHATVAMPAPAFVFFDGHLALGYVAIILTYEILQGGNNDGELAGFAIGYGVVASIISLVRYLRVAPTPTQSMNVYSK